ncbi:VWA domain-containing protein [Gordonia sp. NPDC003504]
MNELDRWRLILGRYAEEQLDSPTEGSIAARRAAALDELYSRAYRGRGVRLDDGTDGAIGPGTGDPSDPRLVEWLGEVRDLFGTEVSEVIVEHALERFGLTGILADPVVMESLPASTDLLKLLLVLRRSLPSAVDSQLRRIVAEVVTDIRRRLEPEIRRVLAGTQRSFGHSPLPVAANFDLAGTVRRNLAHYDPTSRRLVVEELLFFDRKSKQVPWDVIVCVDQSGSMAESMIHSAVMTAILAGLPTLRLRLVVFDTSVVDLSDHVDDPITTLMSVQLGGGTDIGAALRYCRTLVTNPHRTVLVLVSDFCEGGSPTELYRVTAGLAGDGVRLLGLASLAGADATTPFYDRAIAARLAEHGMHIAALTPRRLADWLLAATS